MIQELQVPKPKVFRNKRLGKVIVIFSFFILNCSLNRGRLVKTDKTFSTNIMDYSVCLVYYNNIVLSKMKILEACLVYRNGNYFVVG